LLWHTKVFGSGVSYEFLHTSANQVTIDENKDTPWFLKNQDTEGCKSNGRIQGIATE